MKYYTAMERAEHGRPTCPGCLRGETADKELRYNVDTWSICVVSKASKLVGWPGMLRCCLLSCPIITVTSAHFHFLSFLIWKKKISTMLCLCLYVFMLHVCRKQCVRATPSCALSKGRVEVSEFHLINRCISVSFQNFSRQRVTTNSGKFPL